MYTFLRSWVVIACFLLSACMQQNLNIVIQYDEVDGLVNAAPVLYNNEKVGEVTKIVYTDDGMLDVYTTIRSEHKDFARKNTDFVIVDHRYPDTPKAIELVVASIPGEALVSGEKINGASRFQAFANSLKTDFAETLESMKTTFNQTVDGIAQDNVDDHLKFLEREIDRWLQEAGSMSKKTKQKINNDVLPNIEKQFSRMKDKMKEMELDKTMQSTMENIEAKLDALSKALQ